MHQADFDELDYKYLQRYVCVRCCLFVWVFFNIYTVYIIVHTYLISTASDLLLTKFQLYRSKDLNMGVFTEEIHYHFSSCKFLSRTFGFWAMHEKVLVSSVYFHVKRDGWSCLF